jgi:hypothetical protein
VQKLKIKRKCEKSGSTKTIPENEDKASIGQPFVGKVVHALVFVMAAPIRDPQGKVIGALAGVTDLGKPNFPDIIAENRYGKTAS